MEFPPTVGVIFAFTAVSSALTLAWLVYTPRRRRPEGKPAFEFPPEWSLVRLVVAVWFFGALSAPCDEAMDDGQPERELPWECG